MPVAHGVRGERPRQIAPVQPGLDPRILIDIIDIVITDEPQPADRHKAGESEEQKAGDKKQVSAHPANFTNKSNHPATKKPFNDCSKICRPLPAPPPPPST